MKRTCLNLSAARRNRSFPGAPASSPQVPRAALFSLASPRGGEGRGEEVNTGASSLPLTPTLSPFGRGEGVEVAGRLNDGSRHQPASSPQVPRADAVLASPRAKEASASAKAALVFANPDFAFTKTGFGFAHPGFVSAHPGFGFAKTSFGFTKADAGCAHPHAAFAGTDAIFAGTDAIPVGLTCRSAGAAACPRGAAAIPPHRHDSFQPADFTFFELEFKERG